MALPQETPSMTEAEYLEFERASEVRHEYVAGKVYEMPPSNRYHSLIVVGAGASLANLLKDTPCLVMSIQMRLQIPSAKSFRYPDVVVVCDKAQLADEHDDILLNPTILIEVVSPLSETTDRKDKLREYCQIESLKEYLLISQDIPRIERYLRYENNEWLYTDVIGLDEAIHLPSLDYSLALADVYHKISFEDS